MLFTSSHFFFYFIFVLFILHFLKETKKANLWLLIASYSFYMFWDYRFLALILISSLIDFYCGKKIYEIPAEKFSLKKKFLYLSLISNFSILFFFKYFNFFTDSFQKLLSLMGLEVHPLTLNLILPLGISFYTFQSVSYTIDIYRQQAAPTKSLISFFLYVSFFPQLVAGPIERSKSLLTQIEKKRSASNAMIEKGIWLILWGAFKKLFIADNLSHLSYWSTVQLVPKEFGLDLWLSGFAFTIQFYCDFSAYSDIAIGLALLMGIQLSQNFYFPYFATNPGMIWDRWHITLTQWFRDYVYIPLRQKSFIGNHIVAIGTTMTLIGLWHGAQIKFIVWGLSWAAVLALYHGLKSLYPGLANQKTLTTAVMGGLITFCLWLVLNVVFVSESLANALVFQKTVLTNFSSSSRFDKDLVTVLFYISPLLAIEIYQYKIKDIYAVCSWNLWAKTTLYIVLSLLLLIQGSIHEIPFLYFQF